MVLRMYLTLIICQTLMMPRTYFWNNKKSSYSVLVHVLDTPKSIKFVKKHDETQDAQALYADLLKAYQEVTYTSILITDGH